MFYLIYDGRSAHIETETSHEKSVRETPETEDYTYTFATIREAEDFLEADGYEGGIAFSPGIEEES